MYVKASVDYRNAFRKLNETKRLAGESAQATVWKLADLGKYRAKEIAPFWSGETSKMIRAIKKGSVQNPTAMIISPNRGRVSVSSIIKKKYDGSVPKFLHSQDYERLANKSGESYYMDKTAKYLNSIKRDVAKNNFKKINLR